jgi:hypothetical protein
MNNKDGPAKSLNFNLSYLLLMNYLCFALDFYYCVMYLIYLTIRSLHYNDKSFEPSTNSPF